MEILGTLPSRIQAERMVGELVIEGDYELTHYENELAVYARKGNGGVTEEITVVRKAERQWQVVRREKQVIKK